MKSGIIMEINRRFLTVLTPNGEFLHVRRQDQLYQVGQEINFSSKELEKKRSSFFNTDKNCFNCMCFCFSFYIYYPSVSGQSSVRLYVD